MEFSIKTLFDQAAEKLKEIAEKAAGPAPRPASMVEGEAGWEPASSRMDHASMLAPSRQRMR